MELYLERVYDQRNLQGYRILIDRLWPRGISKKRAAIDYWAKEIAPSRELRVWFNHKSERFKEFAARYTEELDSNPDMSPFIEMLKQHPKAILVYGAKDPKINHAVVLQEYLKKKIQTRTS